ncbi:hypothetical protein M153_4180002734 [Pseudoloma neurophilia]|uniref:Uncharacterized protein n=1 Tax=Pseudoloma neurophilia TaxID=146866 RepID=A0A0R0LXJ0_9MICR|nr:hypothetical protein M153_4180002734 [Pseudoloma neurophilia]
MNILLDVLIDLKDILYFNQKVFSHFSEEESYFKMILFKIF